VLILSRKLNESIVIDGRIVVKVVRVDGEAVKLGICAPADVPVHRQEIYEEIQRNNQQALTTGRAAVALLTKVPRPAQPAEAASPFPLTTTEKPQQQEHP
jgi:carbon storage regulator